VSNPGHAVFVISVWLHTSSPRSRGVDVGRDHTAKRETPKQKPIASQNASLSQRVRKMSARFLRPHHHAMHPALCVLFPSCSAQHPPLACALLVPVHLNVPRHHCWKKRDKRSRSLRAENSFCKNWHSKTSRTMAPAQMRPDMFTFFRPPQLQSEIVF